MLRTSPERRGLRALVAELDAQRRADIGAAQTTSRVLRGAIREADPRVAAIYADARRGLSSVTGNYSQPAAGIARDFSQLGPAAGGIAEAARAESEAAQRRAVEGETRARTDLQNQGVRAQEGEVFATRAAQARYESEVGKVAEQLRGLDQEEGLYAATEYGRLVEGARGRAVTRRGQTLSSRDRQASLTETQRHNRATERTAARGAKPKRQWVSRDAQNAAADEVGRLAREAQQLASRSKDRTYVAQALSQGVPAEKGPDGSVVLPAVKPAKSSLMLSVALDSVFNEGGHLSRRNQRMLRKRGYKIEPLGVPTYAQWRKRRARNAPPYRPPAAGAPGPGLS